jgi:hypothetical protein
MWKEQGPNIDWEKRNENRITNLTVQAVLWPTPTTKEKGSLWPTPIAQDAGGSRRATVPKKASQKSKDGTTLTDASRLHGAITTRGEDGLSQVFLNPQFVESLMGLPIGWTDFAPLETQSYHNV